MKFKQFKAVAAAAIVAAGAVAAMPAWAADTLRVGKPTQTSFNFALLEVGVEAGIFQKHDLTLELIAFGGAARLQQALAVDAVDIGISGLIDMLLIVKGAPVIAVAAVNNELNQIIVVAADGPIQDVDDLAGQTFAASSATALSGWLPQELARARGWKEGIKLNTGGSQGASLALLKTNQIQAMTLDEVAALSGVRAGELRMVFDMQEALPGFHQNAFFATTRLVQENPDALRRFLAAWLETVAYARTHKEEATKVIAEATSIDADLVTQVYDKLIGLFSDTGAFHPDVMAKMRDAYVELGILDEAPDVEKLYTEEYLPKT